MDNEKSLLDAMIAHRDGIVKSLNKRGSDIILFSSEVGNLEGKCRAARMRLSHNESMKKMEKIQVHLLNDMIKKEEISVTKTNAIRKPDVSHDGLTGNKRFKNAVGIRTKPIKYSGTADQNDYEQRNEIGY